ncbi:MAG: metal-dependent hydrolase [Candidatus Gastranaerophilales bacterium]|nr:metal-dependent hydrolase [Candidatus Gastranaerophilales bacterium]
MSINLKYLGHSAFIISDETSAIIIDPFLTGNPKASDSADKIIVNDILLTHAHSDHLGDAIEISKKTQANITAIFELANYCSKKGANAQGINMGGKIKFDWGYAVWLPASHSSSLPDGKCAGDPASIFINFKGISIYHAGDTGLHMNLKMIGEYYKPEISLLPIGDYYTMGPDEAVQAAKWLRSKSIIPMHYDTFTPIIADVNHFKNKIESDTDAKCLILKPGELFNI